MIFSRLIHTSQQQTTAFEPTFARPRKPAVEKQPINEAQAQAKKPGLFGQLANKWMALPLKYRLYVCVSTFVVAYGGQLLTDQIYETSKKRAKAKKMAEEELEK